MTEILDIAQEPLTEFISQIDSDHAYVHKGLAQTAIINTGSISAAYDICFTTPAAVDGYVHWRPTAVTTSAEYVGMVMTEGETFSAGTAVTPINRSRKYALANPGVSDSKITDMVKGATCTPAGTQIVNTGFGTSGNPTARSGGGSGAAQEIILAPETKYAITLTPAGATTVTLELFWYEEVKGYIG